MGTVSNIMMYHVTRRVYGPATRGEEVRVELTHAIHLRQAGMVIIAAFGTGDQVLKQLYPPLNQILQCLWG